MPPATEAKIGESAAPGHDLSAGDPTDADPLEAYSWQDLSEMIHEHPGEP